MSGRVMIVEDDREIRESLVDVLEDHGYRAISAIHGRDALDKLAAEDDPPCVIVLDLMMPVMDGATFREEQLRDPLLKEVPIVIISAYQDEHQTRMLHPAAHLRKPLRVKDLLQVVRDACGEGC
jgi:CheY-like chemotaxis protein